MSKTIIICLVGTTGDTLPYFAIGEALKRKGYNVIIGSQKEHEKFVRQHGFDMFLMGDSFTETMANTKEGRALQTTATSQLYAQLRLVMKPLLISWQIAMKKAVETYKPQLAILGSLSEYFGPSIFRKANVPYVVVHPVPAWQTGHFLPATIGRYSLPFRSLNMAVWQLALRVHDHNFLSRLDDEIDAGAGLPLRTAAEKKEAKAARAHTPTYHIVSNELIPQPSDWPAAHLMVGQCILRKDRRIWQEGTKTLLPPSTLIDYNPDAAVETFISKATAAKAPVLYFGFGSMMGGIVGADKSIKTIQSIIDGIAALAQPVSAVIHVTGLEASSIETIKIPEERQGWIFLLRGFVPHSWLFPRCDMIIHHGGVGTTHAGIMYGARKEEGATSDQYEGPVQWVLPPTKITDQRYWGDFITQKQLGPAYVLASKLTVTHVQNAVGEALFGKRRQLWRRNVGRLGLRMWKRKDGSDRIAEEIDQGDLVGLLYLEFKLYVDLTGKTIIVTGANAGIGLEVARYFAKNNAHVVLACRNAEKAQVAISDIKSTTNSGELEFRELDLSSLGSVRAFADEWTAENKGKIDILVNNAGISGRRKFTLTKDNIEEVLQVNHLAPFLLTNLLAPHFINNPGSRVINTSSIQAKKGKLNFNNLDHRKRYTGLKVYNNTKLYNVLFTKALAKKFQSAQSPTVTHSLHPGIVITNIADNMDRVNRFGTKVAFLLAGIDAVAGAQTTIHCAVSKEAGELGTSGSYWSKSAISKTNKIVKDGEKVEQFWKWSAQAVGLKPEKEIGSSIFVPNHLPLAA
ncbi:hypothetical protein BZG36_05445, partial [Bifiguratus adelaidae]